MRFLPVLLVLICASPAFAAGKLPVKAMEMSDQKKTFEYGLAYPQTGNKAVDARIADWAKGVVKEFRDDASGDDAGTANHPYSMDITYDVVRNDAAMFVVVFQEEIDTGGAHPNHDTITFNFQMPDGWRVYLPEIFTTDGLKKISTLAIADLNKQLGGPDSLSDKDWIGRGAGPDWDNFKDFALLPNVLDVQYPPYQVAAYAAGPQETEIPLAPLKKFFRANWRLPVASFDCAAARTPVEHTICSDVALARLDRQEAEDYRMNAFFESDAAKKAAIRDRQRDWLKSRDAACGGQSGGGQIACLTAAYKKRLATPRGEL
jgi:uncharacterized protein YecT (DUF1311 family)